MERKARRDGERSLSFDELLPLLLLLQTTPHISLI